MRTTIDLDESLLQRAKQRALKEGRSVSDLLNRALAAYLSSRREAAKDPAFELIVCGTPHARFPTATEIAAAEEEEELAALAIPRTPQRAAP